MINTITILEDGRLIPCSDCLGRIGEHNSTILCFKFFENLNGESVSAFQKQLVVVLPEGVLKYELTEKFKLPKELTVSEELTLFVELIKDVDVLFKSSPHKFYMKSTGENSGTSPIQTAIDSAREEYRAELETSLETATGENHDNKTWEKLNNTVAELPIISEEQTQALGDWDLIKQYFENIKGSSHHIFSQAPKDADGNNLDYRLPYIYTPKLPWQANVTMLSTNLLEVGVDVSSAVNLGGGGATRTFSPLSKLEKLVLTGNVNNPSLYNFMATNYELKYIKMETPSENVLKSQSGYYKRAFYRCERLITIDCELDFTGQTDTAGMFTNNYLLKDLKIKPFTLRCSLDVSACRYFVHPEIIDSSLISILNAIPNPKTEGENSGITITYSNYAWMFETQGSTGLLPMEFISRKVYFNLETGLYSWEKQTENSRETDLYDAFVYDKGVTLAQ